MPRLFSNAIATASLMERYILPSRISWSIRAELVRFGGGTFRTFKEPRHWEMETAASRSSGLNIDERCSAVPAPVASATAVGHLPGCFVELHFGQNSRLQANSRTPVRSPSGTRIRRNAKRTFPYLLKLTHASVGFPCHRLFLCGPLINTRESA